MKLSFIFSILLFSQLSLANSVFIGCNEQKLVCPPDQECLWLTAMGQAGDVELVKDGVGPGYEIWKGSFSDLAYGQFPFEVSITQKIDLNSSAKTNYLNIVLEVDGAELSGSGNVKYRKDSFGVGLICITDFEPIEN